MKLCTPVPNVQAQGLSILNQVAHLGPEVRARVASEGCFDVVIAAMRIYEKQLGLQQYGFKLLSTMLSDGYGTYPQFPVVSCKELAEAALVEFNEESSVLKDTCNQILSTLHSVNDN
eukprot:GILI01072941.1.p1 GENE.GILI01072941.1~~GILI01072941.1.p1  ORF type:complete len:134 (+),score=15.27 GILI01072941.1:52-402(+)